MNSNNSLSLNKISPPNAKFCVEEELDDLVIHLPRRGESGWPHDNRDTIDRCSEKLIHVEV